MKWKTATSRTICKGCDEKIERRDFVLVSRDGIFCEECGEVEGKNQENMSDEFSQYD